MAYRIVVSPRAQKEIEDAIDYYALHSTDAPQNFVTILKDTYNTLEDNPFSRYDTKISGRIKLENSQLALLCN